MVKVFSQSHKYDDAWQTVTLAYFLRYPNPYASHVLACDVISRNLTDSGTLVTTRLIKKTGALPKWFPRGFVNRTEAWVVEESEVDPAGRIVKSSTRNLDHVKVMQVREDVVLRETEDGRTLQKTTASIVSNFGWGLTKRIEKYGVHKLKSNLERSRQGISVVLEAVRESRRRLGIEPFRLTMAGDHAVIDASITPQPDNWPEHSEFHEQEPRSDVRLPSQSTSSQSSTGTRRWLPRWPWNWSSSRGATPAPTSRDHSDDPIRPEPTS